MHDITRRDFTVGTAAVAAGVVAGGAATALADAAATMTPGTYTGEGVGHRGTIRLNVTVSETAIEGIEFIECVAATNDALPSLDVDPYAIYAYAMLSDTKQILDSVTDRLGDRIVEAQSLNVDAICGATITSFGYIAAVEDALTQAGADLKAFYIDVPKKTDEVVYEDYDVIVVGGGAGGTSAAAAAKSTGAKVMLIEKSARIGGCGSMSTGVRCTHSKLQEEAGFTEDDNDERFADAMKQGLWYPKAPLVRQFVDMGGKAMDFLVENGGFHFNASATGLSYAEDSILEPNAQESWRRLADTVDTLLLETRATELVTDESGAVIGVKAESYDGTKVTAYGKAVVVATGGYMGNAEMQEEYNHATFSTAFAMAQDTGDGLQMMWNAGANRFHIGGESNHITQPAGEVKGFDDLAAMIPHTLHAAPCLLNVNRYGQRWRGEDVLETNMNQNGNYIVSGGGYYYAIVSQGQADILAEQGLAGLGMTTPVFCVNFNFYPDAIDYKMDQIYQVFDAGIEAGFIFKGDTAEELAEATGMAPALLAKSIKDYDACCAAGVDKLFNKNPAYLQPLGDGPYYAVKAIGCPYSTVGGIEVDDYMQVLKPNGEAISGLYCAGAESIGCLMGGAAFSDLAGFSFGWPCYSGYAAGLAAAGTPVEY